MWFLKYYLMKHANILKICVTLWTSIFQVTSMVVVQSPSHVWLFATPWTAACQASLSLTISRSLPKFMSIESVMPSNLWDAISSSVAVFSFSLLSFPASGSFPMSQLFASGDQSIGASASASVLLKCIQDWFPLPLTGLISLLSRRLSRVFSSTVWKHQFFGALPSLFSSSHICTWLLEKPQLWLDGPLLAK